MMFFEAVKQYFWRQMPLQMKEAKLKYKKDE